MGGGASGGGGGGGGSAGGGACGGRQPGGGGQLDSIEEAVRTRFEQAMAEVQHDLKGLNQSHDSNPPHPIKKLNIVLGQCDTFFFRESGSGSLDFFLPPWQKQKIQ